VAEDNFEDQFAEALQVVDSPDKKPEETPPEEKAPEPKEEIKKEEAPEEKKDPAEILAEVLPKEEPKEEEKAEEPKAPEPITKDDIRSIISDLRTEERSSGRELEETTTEVLEKYYPKGLSNTLVDEASGKELKTPQDVVDASGGSMSTEEATQWLMNEQFKLDRQIDEIKQSAKQIAETTVKFKQDGNAVLERYSELFKAYPQVQEKVFNQYIKLVQRDDEKGVILSAPDMQEFYDTMLEPYRMAFEFATKQPAIQPTQEPAKPEPPKPSVEDRMDESGDGGVSEVDDPNDFAQQVRKELKTGV
jgi:hypothetical protein